jgi:hypothetical protein
MPSRFISVAVALAAPLLLAACEQEAQQETEVGQAEDPAPAETEPAAPAEPATPQTEAPPPAERNEAAAGADQPQEQPSEAQAGADQPQGQRTAEQAGDQEILVLPPAEEAGPADDQQTAQAPGEQSPRAAGVASVAAYVGRWAEQTQMCQDNFWTFTNLRLQSPDQFDCDIRATQEREDGLALDAACTARNQPLAEPDQHTMTLSFPNLPQTDTMVVSGGPMAEELTLTRCQLGQEPAAGASPTQNRQP